MVSNLYKSPLPAVLFASLIYFANIFVPYSEDYTAIHAEFTMPLLGNLFLIAFTFWICLCAAIAFGSSEKGAIGTMLPVLAVVLGVYAVPAAEALLFSPQPGFMGLTDTLFSAGLKSACTIVIFLLLALIYKTAHIKAEPEKTAPEKPQTEYKLMILGFIIRIIVLPLIFCCLYYVAWYFLLWSNDAARAFYEGPVEKLGFVPSVVNSLMNDTWMLPLALLRGFIYVFFALPLLFLFKNKRVIFIVLTTMFCLLYPIGLLVPTPYIQDDVRMAMCIFNAALLLPYGALMGVLLHTSFEAKEIEAPVNTKPLMPQQTAKAASTEANPAGPTAKQAAEVVSKTISGKM